MSAGNFSDKLRIDEQGHILPTGPLVVPQEEERITITKLYAWVFQLKGDHTGAMCAAFQDEEGFAGLAPGQTMWEVKRSPIHEGRFVPGPAVGMAVLISRDSDGKPRVYWWSENILLEQDIGKVSTPTESLPSREALIAPVRGLAQRVARLEAAIGIPREGA